MGIYNQYRDGYARESTFGTTAIANAAATTYLWGVLSEKVTHPNPKTKMIYRATGVNAQEVPDTYLWKSIFELTGMYAVGMQNGILLQAVMGYSSTAGPVGGVYTHTISAPTDGSKLDSFTIQHERTGTATNWAVQYLGCKIAGLVLDCNFEKKYLIAKVNWMAKKAIDPGFILNSSPSLPATANIAPYHFGSMSRTFDGNSIDGLTAMELGISPDLTPIFAHTWDAGSYTGQWLYDIIESPRKQYNLTMDVSPDSDDMWDELVSNGNTKNIVFTWTRSTNDYITATLTDCQFTSHEIITPKVGDALVERVECEPRSITFTAKDQIAGAQYGE
jgi:hypothetical protein